jgi:UDP-glucose 4-epimerase
MQKSVLITGVGGLLGSRMADWILKNKTEYEVVGIDSLFGGYVENVNPNITFYKRDLAVDDISDIFERHNFEYVFHFAAYAAEGLSGFKRNFFHSNNILSTGNIINNCVNYNVKRLIFTSSMSVYGDRGEERFDENDIPHPLDPYAIGKYANELDIQSAGHQFGLD